ncbi:MAG TPA: aspartyl protease family protein [Caulobacteraceae bacterium]|jgi:tetratricopeptide (TPR) repeat protein|nr:aspartyl protease family protein [Caulobacteraceae bacterium]
MRLHPILGWLLAPIVALTGFSADAACTLAKLPDLPVTMRGPRAMITAKVNGADGLFVVDSGAFFSSISPASVGKYKLSRGQAPFGMYLSGVGHGAADFSVSRAETFDFDSMPMHNVDFIVLDRGRGASDDGSIGQNILGGPDVEYDLANGAIRLFKPTGCRDASLAYWTTSDSYSVADLQYQQPLFPPTAEATINGTRIRVTFDTGSPRSMLSLSAAARAGVKPTDPGVEPAGYSSGIALRSQFRLWRGRFASFKLGGEEIKNSPLLFGDLDLMNADMLIGADFFLSHRILVSNSQHKIYFTYNGGPVFNLDSAPLEPVAAAAAAPTSAAGAPPAAAGPAEAAADAPQDAPGYARRGAARTSRREYPEAIADFTKAIALAPADPDYPYHRGLAELGNHQPFLAMADFEAALKLKPDDVRILVTRAEVYWGARQPDQAAADLAAADRAAEKDPDKRLAIAAAYASMHRYKEVIPELDQWIAAHPIDEHRSEAFNARCWARAQLGIELDKALADCNEALRLDPGDPMTLDSRGLVFVRTGQSDKAIADYNAALRLRPNLPWSLYGRGLAELRKGMAAEGHADIQAATALDPRLPDEAKPAGLTP